MKQLIVNADDLGYDPAIDRGIVEAVRRGVVTSTTALVTAESAAGALAAVKGLPLGIGLHVNLCRGRPLTAARSFCGASGEMDEGLIAQADVQEIRDEIEAQVMRFARLAGRAPTHLDVHRHLHRQGNVARALFTTAWIFDLPVRALSPEMRQGARSSGARCPDWFLGDTGDEPYWTLERLAEAIDSLDPGVTELMCHPGYRPEVVESRYSVQRETELVSLCDPSIRGIIERRQVRLCDFREAFPAARGKRADS